MEADLAVTESAGPIEGAGVCIGVSAYADGRLTSCPSAGRTARALAGALGGCLSHGAAAVVDPKQGYELFRAIQAAAQKARGGLFVLYFAGVTIRRGDDLLLTSGGTRLDAKDQGVPWSDVDAILAQEKVASGLILLNAEGFAGIGWGGAADPKICGMGSVRIHDPLVAEQRIARYGDAVIAAFGGPARALRAHLREGRLDVAALVDHLVARFPNPKRDDDQRPVRGEAPRHETFGRPEVPAVVFRDLRDELARMPLATWGEASLGRARLPMILTFLALVAGIVVWVLRG